MERTSTQYSVKHFLRVPMLLQLDGRAEEAWAEYQELLSSGYPGQMRSKDMILMDSYQIYDKMRLHLQREGRAKEAVVYHVLSIVCWSRALRLQNRSNEHEHTLTREYAAVQVEKVWRRTKLSTGAEGLASMLHDLLNGLEGMQLQSVEHQIREYLDGCGTGR
ncbi:MAG: hypothetical protein JJ896_01235 [Rhodothermales bacterium]|nr:hypothetical protein [Rhodothermales bacterium]MBO6778252.1 hypothetical protein [Rhodothermales bacterium]